MLTTVNLNSSFYSLNISIALQILQINVTNFKNRHPGCYHVSADLHKIKIQMKHYIIVYHGIGEAGIWKQEKEITFHCHLK